jgi:Na+-transporting methylmalonyl-CoA/oxaloacetate decarboxylase gamma subunit
MDKWAFGFTMMIVGMGATLLTLWVLSLVMSLLKRVFPLPVETKSPDKVR